MMTFFGSTDGVNTTGTFKMTSEGLEASAATGGVAQTVTSLVLPKGIRAKIWLQKISGAATTVSVIVNPNPTGASVPGFVLPSNTNTVIDSELLASSGALELDTRRPVIVDGRNFATSAFAIVFAWSQTAAALATLTVMVEFSLADSEE
jgi:hypothetical protein